MKSDWYAIENVDEVDSPALLAYTDHGEENLRCMITMVGDVHRLRPHMKTHRLPEMIRLQLAHGITQFKCATIAEAEKTAACGAADALLTEPPQRATVETRPIRSDHRALITGTRSSRRSIAVTSSAPMPLPPSRYLD